MEDANLYPFSIEAFKELGDAGIKALKSCIENHDDLVNVYAAAEAHIIGMPADEAPETSWQRVGRAIYILGELGEVGCLASIYALIPKIKSLHLLYHISEAILSLARRCSNTPAIQKRILATQHKLETHPQCDPIVRAYAKVAIDGTTKDRHLASLAGELEYFLLATASAKNPFYKQEFWRRAHGVEALAEVAQPAACAKIISKLNMIEDQAIYDRHSDGDYRQVQSSILKAISRCCDAHPDQRLSWRPILESMFCSARVAENGWACRHLEALLLKSYSDSAGLAWIKGWTERDGLGGPLIERALGNVLWLTS